MPFYKANKIMSRVCVVLICGLLLSGAGISSYAITDTAGDFALAPPLATKPPCEIVSGYQVKIPIPDALTDADRITYINRVASIDNHSLWKYLRLNKYVPINLREDKTPRFLIAVFVSEVIANSFNAIVDKLIDQKSSLPSFRGEIVMEVFLQNDEVCINVIDNGKVIEFESDGKTPNKRVRRAENGHVGGFGYGTTWEAKIINELGANVKRVPSQNGTRTELRIPLGEMPPEFHIKQNELIVLAHEDVIKSRDVEGIGTTAQALPRRLTIDECRQRLLKSLGNLRRLYPSLQKEFASGLEILESEGVDAFEKRSYPRIKEEADKIKVEVDTIRCLPAVFGFSEPDAREKLDAFLRQIAEEAKVDKVLM